jgi:glycosyltransferase XagB
MFDRGRDDGGKSSHARFQSGGSGGIFPSAPSFIAEARSGEERFLHWLGFSKPFVAAMKTMAASNGTSIETELLASGQVKVEVYYEAFARALGLKFLETVDAGLILDSELLDSQLIEPRAIRLNPAEGAPRTAIVPQANQASTLYRQITVSPSLRDSLVVVSPATLRRAVWAAGASRRVDASADALFDAHPVLSARSVLTGGQGFLAGFLATAYFFCLLLYTVPTLQASHVGLSAAFCILVVLRALAARRGSGHAARTTVAGDGDLPVYTVLVALYREKEIVPQLVRALSQLNWPRSRLDIKLVCEAGDRETIDVLSAHDLPPHFEIVEVPDRAPRTKPKALNYALSGARGDYLVIYDAEDRPHPDQLREAYGRFRDAPPELVCLQAPLIIANAPESWISALFALEYSGLFRRLLPYLGRRQQPMPLGGTSNHFRTAILREVGGWDPYNVTEDADLGMRLYRLGYRADTLSRHTFEDAPTERAIWLGQRSRWFKGWMQTWLVLMRQPIRLTRELGLSGTLMFHVLVTGMLVSALGHPLILFFIAMTVWNLTFAPHVSVFEMFMLILDWFNILFAYTVFVRLGWQAMGRNERARVGLKWRYVPIYWMLMSVAAWRAAIELYRKPFFWNKTPHKPAGQSKTPPN